LTGHNAQNTEVRHELGRGADHKNIASTRNENARQKPPFCLKDSYLDPSDDLLATSRSLNNKRRRFPRKDKRQVKSTTSLYPPMNIRNEESSIETSTTSQERLRTAHLQLQSTDRVRASTGRWVAVQRESEAAEEVISAAAARRYQARAFIIDNRSATTASMSNRHPAISNGESASVSVDRTMQSDDNNLPEISKHAESRKLHLQRQNQRINTVNSQTSPKSANSAIKCRIANTTPMEKNKIAETTTTGEKKVHRHRFRRKKRQKDRGSRLKE